MLHVAESLHLSFETPVNNINNPILLFRCHLVIARQAQSPPEEIRSGIDSAAGDIGVAPSPAVAFPGDELVGPVDGLQVHGLPNSTCYTCYIGNLSSSRKMRIISCFMLFSAHFRCNAYFPSKLHGVPQCYSCDICFFSFSRSA